MVEPAALSPSRISTQILLEGAQELLGSATLQSLIERLQPDPLPWNGNGARKRSDHLRSVFLQPERFVQALEAVYGVQGGRGLALRIGRAAFKYGLAQLGEQAGLNSVEFRLLPAPRRLKTGLAALAGIVSQEFGDEVQVIDQGDAWLWQSTNCPVCRGRQSEDPCCTLTVGLLQEFASWAGGGRFYRVTEINCRATNQPLCVFRIDKKPLD